MCVCGFAVVVECNNCRDKQHSEMRDNAMHQQIVIVFYTRNVQIDYGKNDIVFVLTISNNE